MKFLVLTVSILSFLLPMATGLIAQEFWLWFYVSIPLTLIATFILVCLSAISKGKAGTLLPVENEEIFDHLFINKSQRTYITLRSSKSRKGN